MSAYWYYNYLLEVRTINHILITGGAGFLGSNLASYIANKGHKVTILDNLSRSGVEKNSDWLAGQGVDLIKKDIKEHFDVEPYDAVYHLAGQVTVTDSVVDPETDFKENLWGTFNVLELVRKSTKRPAVIFTSTNKVYGEVPSEPIDETRPLDFKSPYGCSKGGADQYVHDYYRTYGIETVVLRNSCIYGRRQFGMLGQGWISWFVTRILTGDTLTIFGDGEQVRDILYVDDWVDVAWRAFENIEKTKGKMYNIGGSELNAISLKEAIRIIEEQTGRKFELEYDTERVGDQPCYISDISKATRELGWAPKVRVEEGIRELIKWQQSTL